MPYDTYEELVGLRYVEPASVAVALLLGSFFLPLVAYLWSHLRRGRVVALLTTLGTSTHGWVTQDGGW